ncbi:MAG: hypothetical protein O3A29_22590, partial [Planctomycetota bacterium]|nr:hypothetical protein [Planctomycetota bacterium]
MPIDIDLTVASVALNADDASEGAVSKIGDQQRDDASDREYASHDSSPAVGPRFFNIGVTLLCTNDYGHRETRNTSSRAIRLHF